MIKKIITLILLTLGFFSCKQNNKITKENIEQTQKINDKNIYTTYKYSDSKGASLIIQNSLPKGGMKYSDTNGEAYNYAVFWTRIINDTKNPLELKLDFPVNLYKVPSLPDKYFKIVVPSDSMTLKKSSLLNYGLTGLKSFLDTTIHKSSSLKRIINSKGSTGFYVVILCLADGARGTLRAELTVKGETIYYKINNKEIKCGSINVKKIIVEK